MKILKVEFQNLNSLKGKWEINFEVYNQDGIFAIFGPTGSGKTTILDAITLGLYGQTSRLGSISKSTNEILNKDSASCFANVYFKAGNNKYLASWRQQKANNKVSGKLQDPQRKLYLITEVDGQEVSELLAEKVQTVKLKIEEIIKLNFEQFTRIVLLPQGAFANFLKANGDARAAILEKITDTYKYSKISEKVHFLTSEKEKAINDAQLVMQSIVCKSDEEVTTLQEEANLLASQIEEYKKSSDNLQQEVNNGENLNSLYKEKETLAKLFTSYQQNEELFKPKAALLALGLKAEQLALDYHNWQTSSQSLKKTNQNLAKAKEDLSLINEKLTSLTKLKESLTTNLTLAEVNYNKELPIITAIRKIDSEISFLDTNKNNIEKDVITAKAALTQVNKDIDLYQNNLTKKESNLNKVSQFVNNHPEGEVILTQYAAWEHQFKDISLQEANQAANLAAWQESEENLTNYNNEITTILTKIATQKENYQNSLDKQSKENEKLATLLDGSKKENIEENLALLKELREQSIVIASLEDKRKNLKDNERCPLCGSLDHPYAIGVETKVDQTTQKINEVENYLKQITKVEENIVKYSRNVENEKAKLDTLNLLLEEKLKNKESLINSVNNAKKLYEEKNQEITTAKNNLVNTLAFLGVKDYPKDYKILLSSFNKIAKEFQKSKDNIFALTQECTGLKATISSLSNSLVEKEENLAKKQTSFQAAQKELLAKQANRFEQYGDKNPDKEEQRLKKLFNDAKESLDKFEEDFNRIQNNKSSLAGQLSNLELLQNQQQEEYNCAHNNFIAKLKENNFTSLDDYKASILSKEDITSLQDEQEKLKASFIKLTTQKQTNESKIKELEEKASSEKSLVELKELLISCKKSLQEAAENRSRILSILEENNTALSRKKAQEEVIASLVKAIEPWRKLRELIGSADGKKFRTYVQALTLQNILKYANIQLSNITPNYTLIGHQEGNELSMDIDVIDANNNCTRPTSNLSGGETFVVSLALALGLASMASNNIKVESLFLDEGFGTLDAASLDIVLDTLANLREEGKTIGIISHVEALKERIDKKITLKTSCGISIIEGDGISSLGDNEKSPKEKKPKTK